MTRSILFLIAISFCSLSFCQIGSRLLLTDNVINNGSFYTEPAMVDVDNDNLPDMVIATNNGQRDSIFWLKNTGTSFTSKMYLNKVGSNAEYITYMAWEDVTSDGYPDLLLCVEENSFQRRVYWRLYRNLQNGNLSGAINLRQYPIMDSGSPQAGFYDVDNDGDKDIVIADFTGLVQRPTLHENNGSGTSWTSVNTNLSSGDSAPAFALIDTDTIPDIVFVSNHVISSNRGLVYLKGLGNGNFSTNYVQLSTSMVSNFRINDIDDDGDQDVLSYGVLLHENDGLGTLTTSALGIGTQSFIKIVDLDKDGRKDILSGGRDVFWSRAQGSNTFSSVNLLGTISGSMIDIFDYDGDSNVDFISVSNDSLYLNRNFIESAFSLSGMLFYDVNQNKVKDTNEVLLPFMGAEILPDGGRVLNSTGSFEFFVDSGTYIVNAQPINNWQLTTDSTSYTTNLSLSNTSRDSLDFGFYPSTVFTDLAISLNPGFPRCNSQTNYWFNLKNIGTTQPSGTIELQLDDSIQYVSSTVMPDSVNGKNYYWHYDSLDFFEERRFNVLVDMPGAGSLGDTLQSTLTVNEIANGSIVRSFADTSSQVLRCAYDPNDKAVSPLGNDSAFFISSSQELNYLIRFQNTGTDTAFNVVVRDLLDQNLDRSTFEVVASSHSMNTTLNDRGEIAFEFFGIELPDSNVNEPASHGFIRYRITPLNGVRPFTEIRNYAEIYFDSNPAIVTNTVFNTIECPGFPIPTITQTGSNVLQANAPGNPSYQWFRNAILLANRTSDTLQPSISGNYSVTATDSNNCETTSAQFAYTATGLQEAKQSGFKVYPNPVASELFIELKDGLKNDLVAFIYNSEGKKVSEKNLTGVRIKLNTADFAKGIYFLRISESNGATRLNRVLIIE